MRLQLAAMAALAIAPVLSAQAQSRSEPFTLADAVVRVAALHPDLRLVDARREVLDAQRDGAAVRPPWTVGATLENALGSGAYRGVDQAELTVTLAGVLERGDKLDARRVLAQANLDTLAPQREIARLDLLAETARRYLQVSAAIGQGEIAKLDVEQRQRTVVAARKRLAAGASPESVVLTAQAALAEAELDRDRAAQAEQAARQHLAALWNGRDAQFGQITGDPLWLPMLDPFPTLAQHLERAPELAQLAGEDRIREARLRLASTEATADLQWQVGARALRPDNDMALVAGLSLPLGAAARAQPGIRAARAEWALGPIERESLAVGLYSALAASHGQYMTARLEAQRLGNEVLPKLAQAEQAADRAWRAGAISYMEWGMLQDQRVRVRARQLQAALLAQTALIEIQRLVGLPIVAADDSSQTKDATE
ncbi:MAG TPA: TolC family protein [Stenotrophomonas sp.]|jgi:cobalt-zinc-cadmium efflux system outer membrane protein